MSKGFGAAGILVIVGIIIIVGGLLYSGALRQEADLREDDTSLSSESENESMMNDENNENMVMPEIGTEDEMMSDEGSMMEEGDNALVTVDITGKNFEFSQKEIRVKKGDRVRINFTSTDGFHDWVVDEFNAVTTRVSTGDSTFVEFVADTAGTFEYYCSVGNHRSLGMKGSLIVE